MKKLLLVLAVAGFVVACNNESKTTPEQKDSATTVQPAATTVDSTVKATVDSTKAAVDTSKKAQ